MPLLSIVLCLCLQSAVDTTTFEIMTFNIRYDNPSDGAHAWEHRKERVSDIMGEADIIGVQEALKNQVHDMASMLPTYSWFGAGRDDGEEGGEFSPVFYRSALFEVMEQGTFWLSGQPGVPGSIGWDAAITRIVTWGHLRHKDSGTVFWLFNTHFDHRGQKARENSASLIVRKIEDMVFDDPVIVTGDFNASETSLVYRTMVGGRLKDARKVVLSVSQGPSGTFSGFEVDTGRSEARIDYIFVGPPVRVSTFETIDQVLEGRYPSDHRPVIARVAI